MTVPPEPTLTNPPWRNIEAAVLEVSRYRLPVEDKINDPLAPLSVVSVSGADRDNRDKALFSADKATSPTEPVKLPEPVCNLKVVLLAEVSKIKLPVDLKVKVLADRVVG